MEDEERQKKLIRGKALLAQYQLKKARAEAQNSSKQQKGKKKPSAKKCEESSHTSSIDQSQSDELYMTSSQRGASVTPDITRTLHTGEIIKHDQSYTIEMESEISTTTDDYSSEVNGCSLVQADIPTNLLMEEEFGVGESYSEQGTQFPSKRLEMMENELAGKQQEIEELNRELEEMRAAYGTEGFQQLQEFEAAIKQRDGIITQLTATLQQARREKDETMREFLEVTEQSQKLQIQFHHLQASQSLRNTSHSSTAVHLLQAKHQIVWQQQQLEQQHRLLEDHHKKKEEFKMQINFLQEKIGAYEMEMKEQKDSSKKELEEKDSVMEELKIKLVEEEENSVELKDKLIATDKLLGDFKEQIVEKEKEISNIRLELANSEQKERQRSGEIKQLMGTVEELQKKSRKESQLETETVQRMEIQTQQKLEKLRVELDEMYGQQIVQMKQELIKQHMFELEELNAQHKGQLENALKTCRDIPVNENQIQLINMAITELNLKLQDAISQKEKISKELEIISRAKSILQSQLEDLFEELSFSREQVQRARQTIAEQEDELNEAHKLLSGVADLKAQIVSASEFRKDLELKHEAEVSNYKIKLEMLEKEKNAVFDRMADSREAELERLRTQLLFSHEEELTRLREGLEIEHEMNIEKLKDNLSVHDKQQIEELQKEMSHEMESIQFEKDNLITKQNQLFLEISKLRDLQQSLVNSKSEEMTLQIKELQKEIEVLRQEEKEKGTLEQEVQELQLKTEFLERQIKEKEDDLQEKFTQLETEHTILKNEKKTLEDMLKIYSPISKEEGFIFIDSVKPKSEECEWQKKIDILLEENEKLTKQCTQLNEEIERQRNTYSFAEKNFETNYQELREEYAYLLKLEHAKVTQTELVCESFRRNKKTSKFLKFQEPVSEEQKAREHLDSELGRTEYIIGGEEEKALFESEFEEKGNLIDYLAEELFCVGRKLEELEEEKEQIEEERKLFSREIAIWKAEKLQAHQELLEETGRLAREKLEVQRQAEKVCGDLQKQVKALEIDVEEQVSRFKELEQEKTTEVMDLRQQNQFLEKQLEKMRKFLDEQAFDREHERDVFQQEIQKLEQKLKATPKFQPVSEDQTREVEQLTNHLNEKTDKCSELLLSKEQLQRDVQERNKEIEKLESRIRELEQALLTSANRLQKVENRKHFGAVEAKELPFEVQLQAEREALDRKEKEITNLEEQLEQFREELENKNEELQQLHMQLEIEKKERRAHLEDLEQEKRFLQDETERLGFAVQEFEDSSTKDHHQVFGKFTQMIQEKKLEIGRQNDHITDLQKQLEVTADKKVIQEKDEEIHYLESQLECLKSNQERIKKNSKEEIEQLNDVIEKLHQELSSIEQRTPVDCPSLPEESDSLKHQVDTLTANKLALEQQTERVREELLLTHVALGETRYKMNRLKEELNVLKEEKYDWEQTVSAEDAAEDEDGPFADLDAIFGTREDPGTAPVTAEDLVSMWMQEKVEELMQRNQHLEDEKEQSQVEREALQREIDSLQEMLREQVAALVVSRAQLRAVQEYVGSGQQIKEVSLEPQKESASKPSGLAAGTAQQEDHMAEMNKKQQAEAAEKNTLEKDLEKSPEEAEKERRQEGEDRGIAEVIKCRAAMEYIQSADRRSLLSEIQPLRAQINTEKMTMKREEESDSQSQELLEHNMQQKQAQILEMQVELSALKEKAAELQEELSSERVRAADLQDERTQARLELETTLKAQHKHLKELEAFRMEAKEKTEKVHLLNDTLANEQKETRELQWALEKEKAKLERSEEREREELEDLKYSLEGQKQRNVQLNQLLE
ncbi:uncharacterized protein [Notamacropus eugenii]|uniref:uncharacterized protein isoform X3 n=1 Tax=Notamacropus eugenii TaxID=9315 RepID=UPI003B678556